METVVSIYQLTNTLITLYGYWKTANVCYTNYQRTRLLFDTMVGILNKLQNLLDKNKDKNLILPIEKIEQIRSDIENSKQLKRVYYSKKPFKVPWEILYKEEIEKEIQDDKQEIKYYLLPNIMSFYSYTDEHGNTVTEL